ncbi:MAG: hypothetical protein R2942_09130 [Ignavibacteria bacterium]
MIKSNLHKIGKDILLVKDFDYEKRGCNKYASDYDPKARFQLMPSNIQ